MRCGADSFVQVIWAPWAAAMRSASRLTDDGQRDAGVRRSPRHTSVTSASSACSLLSAFPSSSMIVAVSPSGSMTMPRWLPEARTSSASRATRPTAPRARPSTDAVLANGFTDSTSAPVFASTARHHDRRRAVRVVEHDLERRARATARCRPCRIERRRVELERPGRVLDVADVAGERRGGSPRGTSRRSILRCVDSSMSRPSASKNRISTVSGSPGVEAHGDPAPGLAVADLEARERHGGELDVLDVGAGEVQAADHGPLQRPRRSGSCRGWS